MQLGRIGLTEDGAVVIGSVLDKKFNIISDEIELKKEIDKYTMIVCAGMMNNMFTNQRLMDWLIDVYTEKEIEDKFISSFNIKYYSELNRYTTFKHLFYSREIVQPDGKIVREIDKWDVETIREWTSGYKHIVGKLTTMCLIDFIKSTCSLEKYMDIRNRNGYMGYIINQENILDEDTIEQKTNLNINQARSKFWRRNSLRGQVLLIGCGKDQDFIVDRYSGNDIYSDEDGTTYKVSIHGFMSKLRYEMNLASILKLINTAGGRVSRSKTLEQNVEDNYMEVENFYYDYCIRNGYKNTPDCMETSKYNTAYLSKLYVILKDFRDSISGIQIYEISRDRITFLIRENTDIQTILIAIQKILSEHCEDLFETITVGDTNPNISYLNVNNISNSIKIKDLKKLNNIEIHENLPKNPKIRASTIMEIIKSIS